MDYVSTWRDIEKRMNYLRTSSITIKNIFPMLCDSPASFSTVLEANINTYFRTLLPFRKSLSVINKENRKITMCFLLILMSGLLILLDASLALCQFLQNRSASTFGILSVFCVQPFSNLQNVALEESSKLIIDDN